MAMPTSAPGSMIAITRRFHSPQYEAKATTSLRIRIGSVIPAAWTGEIASERIGMTRSPTEPNPPLARPSTKIAGIAAA